MTAKQQSDKTVKRLIMIGGISLTMFAPTALAQNKGFDRPQLFNDLVECQTITDSAARLACYDQKVAQLDSAQKNNELLVADRAEVQEAERGVFGLQLPRIKLFGGNDDDQQITEITLTVVSAKQMGRGKWFLTLDDGATWVQTDNTTLSSYPKTGSSILIKRAAIGSFLAKVNGGRAFRIKRVVE